DPVRGWAVKAGCQDRFFIWPLAENIQMPICFSLCDNRERMNCLVQAFFGHEAAYYYDTARPKSFARRGAAIGYGIGNGKNRGLCVLLVDRSQRRIHDMYRVGSIGCLQEQLVA